MEDLDVLPFQVGQLAEAKSFQKGYRGAWFRCKIHAIVVKNGFIHHEMEYIDFPDDKRKMTRIYQLPVWKKLKGKQKNRELMVRPQYPCKFGEINLPLVKGITEITVGIADVWKAGDAVEWLADGCFWTGRVTQILADGKAEITLVPSPEGEGGLYEVSCKELRPALDWSLEHGWKPSNLQGGVDCYNYARLMQQMKQGIISIGTPSEGLMIRDTDYKDEALDDVHNKAVAPINASISSHMSANSLPASEIPNSRKIKDISEIYGSNVSKTQVGEDSGMRDSGNEKPSLSDSVSTSHIKCASTETAIHTGTEDLYDSESASKRIKNDGSLPLNSTYSDSLDAVIMDLEELVNKIEWLKGILDSGKSNGMEAASWKLVEHPGSSTPK